ncbi:MAG: hypothetical protein ACLQVJ_17740 [Syntrophobacteraceae bacterium]
MKEIAINFKHGIVSITGLPEKVPVHHSNSRPVGTPQTMKRAVAIMDDG